METKPSSISLINQHAHNAVKEHAKEPIYINSHERGLGINGWQAGYGWTAAFVILPLLSIVEQVERTRAAQRAFFSSKTDRNLKAAKKEEMHLDQMISNLRRDNKLPPVTEPHLPSQQGTIFQP